MARIIARCSRLSPSRARMLSLWSCKGSCARRRIRAVRIFSRVPGSRSTSRRPGRLRHEYPGPDGDFPEMGRMLLAGEAEGRLLEQLLGRCKRPGLLKGRGRRGTDATDVQASVRTLNRLEWLAETLRSVR